MGTKLENELLAANALRKVFEKTGADRKQAIILAQASLRHMKKQAQGGSGIGTNILGGMALGGLGGLGYEYLSQPGEDEDPKTYKDYLRSAMIGAGVGGAGGAAVSALSGDVGGGGRDSDEKRLAALKASDQVNAREAATAGKLALGLAEGGQMAGAASRGLWGLLSPAAPLTAEQAAAAAASAPGWGGYLARLGGRFVALPLAVANVARSTYQFAPRPWGDNPDFYTEEGQKARWRELNNSLAQPEEGLIGSLTNIGNHALHGLGEVGSWLSSTKKYNDPAWYNSPSND